VCIRSSRAGQLLGIGSQPNTCIVRFIGSSEVHTLDHADLRPATWQEIRAAEPQGPSNSMA
jgi:hypothetical protein